MKPKVSIILVNYNGDKDTLDCVSSLEKIIYKNYEIKGLAAAAKASWSVRQKLRMRIPYSIRLMVRKIKKR